MGRHGAVVGPSKPSTRQARQVRQAGPALSPDEQQLAERVERGAVAVGNRLRLGRVLVKPRLPRLLLRRHLVEDLVERRQPAQLHQVEPRHVEDPLTRLGGRRLQVEGRTACRGGVHWTDTRGRTPCRGGVHWTDRRGRTPCRGGVHWTDTRGPHRL